MRPRRFNHYRFEVHSSKQTLKMKFTATFISLAVTVSSALGSPVASPEAAAAELVVRDNTIRVCTGS